MSFSVLIALTSIERPAIAQPKDNRPGSPTFTRDVAPILFRHCTTCHHPAGSAPFSLLTYDDARSRARLIADVTGRRFMPPWKPEAGDVELAGARRMTDEEISILARWAADGVPLGPISDLPAPPTWTTGWQLGTPDLVVRMPSAFELGADGPDLYRTFVLAIDVDALRYVRAIEFEPGASQRAVHHATILVDRTAASRQRDLEDPAPGYDGGFAPSADYPDGHFLGWARGQQPAAEVSSPPWTLHPGSDLVVQLHLKPTGKPEPVRIAVGLFFTADAPQRVLTMLRLGRQDIDIPAGAARHAVVDSFVLPADVDLYAVQPHAHYRATSVTATATLPDGARRRLISIPDWDFDWQDRYSYVEPVRLPRGSTVSMQFVFDNSVSNRRNPDFPPRRVRWGQSSHDEMAELMLQLAPRSAADLPVLEEAFRRKHRRDVIAGYETRLSVTPDALQLHDDVGQLYLEDGRTEDAVPHLRQSLRLNPRGVAALTNLGVALVLQGRVTEAVAYYRRALDIDSAFAEARNNLSTALLYLGNADEALEHARRAVDLQPGLATAHFNLARVMASRRSAKDASHHFDEALRLRPDWAAALKEYAWMLATHPDPAVRNPQRAIDLASRGVALTRRQQPALLDALGAAYAAAGRFDDATASARAALELLARADPEAIAAAVAKRLAAYQAHKPYVEF
jgi:tetratricopeptide (TPR) repeat protein